MSRSTYNMLVKYPDTNTNGIPVTGATASGNDVTVSFSASEYTNLQYVAGSVYIVPQAVWGVLSGDPATFTDINPIGSGPYEAGHLQRNRGRHAQGQPELLGWPVERRRRTPGGERG